MRYETQYITERGTLGDLAPGAMSFREFNRFMASTISPESRIARVAARILSRYPINALPSVYPLQYSRPAIIRRLHAGRVWREMNRQYAAIQEAADRKSDNRKATTRKSAAQYEKVTR